MKYDITDVLIIIAFQFLLFIIIVCIIVLRMMYKLERKIAKQSDSDADLRKSLIDSKDKDK